MEIVSKSAFWPDINLPEIALHGVKHLREKLFDTLVY